MKDSGRSTHGNWYITAMNIAHANGQNDTHNACVVCYKMLLYKIDSPNSNVILIMVANS